MPPSVHIPTGTQYKTLPFEVKAFDEAKGQVTGYLAVFDNIDSVDDRIIKGAFKKTVNDASSRRMEGRKFLWPMLWMHSPDDPVGVFIDAKEDDHGLLVTAQLDITTNQAGIPNNPQATKVYSGFKMGYIDEMSIGYKPLRHEYVKVDDHPRQVRELKEIQLIEGSAVTSMFAANPQALVTGVKTNVEGDEDAVDFETKVTITGSTAGPIGPRDEAWSGSTAKKQIWAVAKSKDGGLNASLCRKYFMVLDGDPQEQGSWKYPFWYVGNSPHINVGAVKHIAGLAMGSRGVEAPGGIRSKVETLYGRINAKYPDADPLVPPWKGKGDNTGDDGKMYTNDYARHSFKELYSVVRATSVLGEWRDLMNALTKAMLDVFVCGDEPAPPIEEALGEFQSAVLDWVKTAAESQVADVLQQEQEQGRDPYTLFTKAGASISAGTRQMLDGHAGRIKTRADGIRSAARYHADGLHDAADDMQVTLHDGAASMHATGKTTEAENLELKERLGHIDDHIANLHAKADDMHADLHAHAQRLHSIADGLAHMGAGDPDPLPPLSAIRGGIASGPISIHTAQGKSSNSRRTSDDPPAPESTSVSTDLETTEKDLEHALARLTSLKVTPRSK